MNYRHAYHAGNFADVVKHAVLAQIVEQLKLKPTAFRVIDTHAGIGRYDLLAAEPNKTLEWQDGVGRIIGPAAAALGSDLTALLAPYLSVLRAEGATDDQVRYCPGSPRVARLLMRPVDHLVVNELHPDDASSLHRLFHNDPQTTVMRLDGWTALKAVLPPKERRGVVLIDPPFEQPGELERLEAALGEALRRFANGIYLLWYPIKSPRPIERLHQALAARGLAKLLALDLYIREPSDPDVLNGCGLVIVNPPHAMLPVVAAGVSKLATRLAQGRGAIARLKSLGHEQIL
jgi:23S rRNA (adenine2030-N6)-methyltransferase